MADWYSADSADELDRLDGAWSDAPTDNVELCGLLMETARQQVLAYAPESDAADEVYALLITLDYSPTVAGAVFALLGEQVPEIPNRYVFAQLQQAKNIYNAGRIVGDQVGPEGYSFQPRPLSKEIQQIIRPRAGVANVL